MFTALKRLFHPVIHYHDHLWSTVSHTLAVTIELYPLATTVLEHIISNLNLERGAFVLIEDNNIYDAISVGFDNHLHFTFPQVEYLLRSRHIQIRHNIEDEQVGRLLDDLGITLVRVLQVEQQIVGLLVLGGDRVQKFKSDDLEMLDSLCDEISVAISNARSYDKIKQFNITLSQAIKKATVELEETNARLRELDKAKDDFVSMASHELRTPMSSIRSYAWMALHKPDQELTDKMQKYLNRIFLSTERSIDMVNDLLNVSRLESGHMDFNYQSFDLLDVLHNVMDELNPKVTEKEIQLKLIPTQVPHVYADPGKVHQVIANIINNAIKFTPLHGSIEVSFFCDGVMVETSIKDSGVGMNRDDLSHLFVKFGRLDNSYVATATAGGTGLGLYIAKTLIDHMKGTIRAASEGVGKGSTFTFSLPVATKDTLTTASTYIPMTPKEVSLLTTPSLVR